MHGMRDGRGEKPSTWLLSPGEVEAAQVRVQVLLGDGAKILLHHVVLVFPRSVVGGFRSVKTRSHPVQLLLIE